MNWAPNLCRTCGQINETCHLICENNLDIPYKLKKCMNISVYKEDYKPKQICNNCLIKLSEFHSFMEVCHTTNVRFEALLMNKAEWHSDNNIRNYGHQKNINGVLSSISSNVPLNCTNIDLYENSMLSLENLDSPSCSVNNQSIDGMVDSTNSNYTIETNNAFTSLPRFDKHYSNSYNYNSIVHQTSSYQTPTNTCTSLQSSCVNSVQNSSVNAPINSSQSTLVHHHINQSKPVLPDNKSSVWTYLSKYNRMKCVESHGNIVDCTSNQNVEDTVEKQKAPAHGEKETVEKIKTVQKPSYQKRITSVDAIRNYMKIARLSCKLRNQKKKRAKGRNNSLFECHLCDKKFMRKPTLNAHMAIHAKLRPFPCNVCNKTFAVKSDLANHQKLHSEDYKCQQSPKALQQSLKALQQSPKALQQSLKALQQSPKALQQSPKALQQPPKVLNQSPKALQQSPKILKQSPKALQQSLKALQPSPKTLQPSPKTLKQSPKALKQSPKALQQCPKALPVPNKVERHVKIHVKHKRIACDDKKCGRAVTDKRNLESQKCTNTEKININKCEVGGKSQKRKNSLENSKTQNTKRKHKCVECGKEY